MARLHLLEETMPFPVRLLHHYQLHARGSAQGSGDGGEYRNHEVQDFLPKFFFVHGVFSYEF